MVFSHSWSKTSKKKKNEDESYIFAAQDASTWLSSPKYKALLKRIKTHSRLGGDQFDQIYYPLIKNFFQFCQSFPHIETPDSLHVNVALSRASQMLEQVAEKVGKHQNAYKEFELLRLLYGIFSSALLCGIGLLDRDRLISLTDSRGYHIQDWNMLTSPMMEKGDYYRVRFARIRSDQFAATQAMMLAYRVMPAAGLAWVAQDNDLYLAWARALHHFEDGYSDFELLHDIKSLWDNVKNNDIIQTKVAEPVYVKELEAAEMFWQWLKEMLEKNKLEFNQEDSAVHTVEGGGISVNLERVFRDFQKTYPQFRDWVVVQRQFNHLGIVPLSGYDLRFQQYFKVNTPNPVNKNNTQSQAKQFGMYNKKQLPKDLKNVVYFANISLFVNPGVIMQPENGAAVTSPKGGILSMLFKGLLASLAPAKQAQASRGK